MGLNAFTGIKNKVEALASKVEKDVQSVTWGDFTNLLKEIFTELEALEAGTHPSQQPNVVRSVDVFGPTISAALTPTTPEQKQS